MPHRTARAAAVAAACLTATVALAPAAHAETRTFTDGGAHLTSVRVSHTATKVGVRAFVGPFDIGDHTTFWLDTDAGDSGPEYKADVWPNTEGPRLMRVGSFTSGGTAVDCDGFRATSDAFGPEEVALSIPRSCLGRPAEVRVAVRAFYAEDGGDVVDWGPKLRSFYGWVAR